MKPWFSGVLAACILLAMPVRAEDCKPLKMFESIALSSSPDGRRLYVPVQINGQDKRLLLDTGAPISMISDDMVKALAIGTHQAKVRLYAVTGSYTDRYARVTLKIGRLNLGESEFMVSPGLNDGDEPDVVGILGTDFLAMFDIAIDPAAKKLDLLDPDHCPEKVIYWPASAIAKVPVERLRDGHIVVSLELDGKPVRAILDTGASGSTLRITAAHAFLGIEAGSADTPAVGELNGTKGLTTYRHVFKTLSFEGVAVANPTLTLIPEMTEEPLSSTPLGTLIRVKNPAIKPELLLGMDILRHMHFYIAYKEHVVYFTPLAPAPQNP
ncbi:MAG: retroviral-like aspartic protease family protein [Rhizomicrobium sp.]|nr:retroviral-like aspartic protease family protein [Rhizomicrobium sp.]